MRPASADPCRRGLCPPTPFPDKRARGRDPSVVDFNGCEAPGQAPAWVLFPIAIASRRGKNALDYEILTMVSPDPSRGFRFLDVARRRAWRRAEAETRREEQDDHRTEAASDARGRAARPRADRGSGAHAPPEPGSLAHDHWRDRRRGEAAG